MRRGRPKSLKTLQAEALRESLERAARLTVGEAFPKGSGFDRLAAAGIIAVPDAPKLRKRGGQPKSTGADEQLVWLTDWFLEQHRLAAKKTTKRKAVAFAMHVRSDLREWTGSNKTTWAKARSRGDPEHYLERHYYAAKLRVQKKKHPQG